MTIRLAPKADCVTLRVYVITSPLEGLEQVNKPFKKYTRHILISVP